MNGGVRVRVTLYVSPHFNTVRHSQWDIRHSTRSILRLRVGRDLLSGVMTEKMEIIPRGKFNGI